jgi:hypothetical protein
MLASAGQRLILMVAKSVTIGAADFAVLLLRLLRLRRIMLIGRQLAKPQLSLPTVKGDPYGSHSKDHAATAASYRS